MTLDTSERAFAAETESARLLDDLAAFVRRYVVLDRHQADTVALWICHTYVHEAAELSPYLAISSAEMRSGKTTLMKLLERLVSRPWRVITPSEAVVYRKIDRTNPTLLLDEYDAIWADRDQEPLRALLNAGNEPGTTVPRCAGANRDELVDYAVYCPKALAGIGKLPATIADRSIEIRMKRKAPLEEIERFRRREVTEQAEPLHQELDTWGPFHADELSEARPTIPDELNDRAADGWEALLAIADLAGGSWPGRGRRAALVLSGEEDEEQSTGLLLLADVKAVFENREEDRIHTSDLIEALAAFEESPWGEWWWSSDVGKPTKGAPRRLAHLIKPYGPRSHDVRIGDKVAKGYREEDFLDPWTRFLPPPPENPLQARQALQPTRHGDSDVADVADVAPFDGTRRDQ
jgi:hypothetical protein